MNHGVINRRKVIAGLGACMLASAVLATPAGRNVTLSALVDFAETTARVVRIPCWITDHRRCFSLDRLDPTCPQCM
jgi:hypothetical protein